MKKLIFVFLLFFSFILYSCTTSYSIETSKNVYYVGVGEKVNLEYKVVGTLKVESFSDIISIKDNVIEGVSVGNCRVILSVEEDSSLKIEVSIYVFEKTFEVEIPTTMYLGQSYKIDINVLNENSIITYTVSSNLKLENSIITVIDKGSASIVIEDTFCGYKETIDINILEIDTTTLSNALNEYLETLIDGGYENLLTEYNGYTLSYEGENVSSSGVLKRSKDDFETDLKVTINNTFSKTIKFLIWGTFTDEVVFEYLKQFENGINKSMDVNRNVSLYGGSTVTFRSTNEDIFNNKGQYNRPFNDCEVVLNLSVTTKSPEVFQRKYQAVVVVLGEEVSYKSNYVKNWIYDNFKMNSIIYSYTVLPTAYEEVECLISWYYKEEVLDLSKIYTNPVLGDNLFLTAKMTFRDGLSNNETLSFRVWEKEFSDLEKIEYFVEATYQEKIRSFSFMQASNPAVNQGLVHFVDNSSVSINQEYLLSYTYGKVVTGVKRNSTEYIVIHDTAGGSPTHTALHFAQAQQSANNNKGNDPISWHFTVGDDGIYQSLPIDETAFHAGDSAREYGSTYYNTTYKKECITGGNKNGIGIETCVNQGGDYNITMKNLAKLVSSLLIEFDLGFDRIKQHYDFSGKHCPAVLIDTKRFEELRDLIKMEYFLKTELPALEVTYTPITTHYLNNLGSITSSSGDSIKVSYIIKVTLDTYTKEYTKETTVLERIDLR